MFPTKNDVKLFELIKSMVNNFLYGDYYIMNGQFTDKGYERWIGDKTIGKPGRLNLHEVNSFVSISIEHLWRVLNKKDTIISKIFMPDVVYHSYRPDSKDEKSISGFYSSMNCEFLKEYSQNELVLKMFPMLDELSDYIVNQYKSHTN